MVMMDDDMKAINPVFKMEGTGKPGDSKELVLRYNLKEKHCSHCNKKIIRGLLRPSAKHPSLVLYICDECERQEELKKQL